jgi:hypothetical protein
VGTELQQFWFGGGHHRILWGAVLCFSPFRIDEDCPGIEVACVPYSVVVGLAQSSRHINDPS